MRWHLWSIQPKIANGLGILLSATGVLMGLWTLVAGSALWSSRRALADEQTVLRSLRQKIEVTTADLRQKQVYALQANQLRMAAPEAEGGVEFTAEVDQLAHASAAQLAGARLIPGDANAIVNGATSITVQSAANASQPSPAAVANVAAANQPAANAAITGSQPRWSRVAFQYDLAGSFDSTLTFLDRLAALPRVIEITAVHLERENSSGPNGSLRIKLHLSGMLYGSPEAP